VTFEYPVHFTEGLFEPANPVLADVVARLEPERRHRCLVFVDDGLLKVRPTLPDEITAYARHHAARMTLVGPPIAVPGGEKVKNELFFVEQMLRQVFEHGIDRHSYVIAVGGGALLDAVGLAAATIHRGVRLIRVPTTVLAQDDSGVGVKNGVNLFGVKNFCGTFAPPFAVLNDLDLLTPLAERDKIAGMAEAVKVALIRDGAFFAWLERNADHLIAFQRPAMVQMIRRCAELHMHQIAHGGDPFETGSARPLDYGHWSAHKLESLTKHHVRHGEAVAIGIALDARYSVLAGLLEAGQDERICALLEHLGFRLWHPAFETRLADGSLAIFGGLREFREHLGGELTVTLLAGIGQRVEVHVIDEALMLTAVNWLKARAGTP
jgi:3-dehydroquinate synthase